jgi:flavin-dependent dehydrogenase
MSLCSAEIGIVGGGPAGAHAATELANAGRDVILFEPKGAWEKPCGGGVTSRALREFQFLCEGPQYPRTLVSRLTLVSPIDRRLTVDLKEPYAIYSRVVLNRLVLDRAIRAGARVLDDSIAHFHDEGDTWALTTRTGDVHHVRFLIGADGAASTVRRRLLGILAMNDLALAMGYNIQIPRLPGVNPAGGSVYRHSDYRENEVVVRFIDNFTGYFWVFPRPNGLNVGLASRMGEKTSSELRALLARFARFDAGQHGGDTLGSFFAAKVPVLSHQTWASLRASGHRWALVGDAAGFVDPVTGEGIYYALKSADLLAQALNSAKMRLRRGASRYDEATATYERNWRQAFGTELDRASQMVQRCYRGRFLGHVFTDATIRLARWHAGVRSILTRAIMGDQSYLDLKGDLRSSILKVF